MKKDGEEKGAITINPERILEILRRIMKDTKFSRDGLKSKGLFYGIDDDLRKKGITHSKRMLMTFLEDYPRLLEFMGKVQGMKFFKRLSLDKIQPKELVLKLMLAKEQLLAQGYPVVFGPHVSVGYKNVKGIYELNLKKVPVAKQLFETLNNGGNFSQLCKKHKLNRVSTRRTMRNPLYIGIIKYKDTEYHFPNLAIIDESLWKACHNISYRPPTFGLTRGGLKNETAPKVVQLFDLRLKRLTFAEIEEETHIPRGHVRDIIRNPIYANKRKILGKPPDEWPDGGVEPIISFETWLETQKIFGDRSPLSLAVETKKKKEIENRNKLLAYIASREPQGLRFTELKKMMQTMQRSESQLKRYLHGLKDQGLIQKQVRHWHVRGERDTQHDMICEIYRLRQERKSLLEIAGAFGISTTPVRRILKNPNYRDVVGEDLWEAVQKIKIPQGYARLKERRKTDPGEVIEDKILQYLESSGPAVTSKIMKGTELPRSTVQRRLRWLKQKGSIDREFTYRGKWFLLQTDKPRC